MVEKFKQNLYLLVGLVLTSLLFITNYTPGSFLMGWDNLQTDLNPVLGIKRAFFGVWQEYQSFGLLSGLSHGADLIRAIFITAIAPLIPQNMIRFLFHHLMIFVGFCGMVRFCQDFFPKGKSAYIAILGGVFYVLNFGTIQILGLPWEAFSVFFAFFPWEVWIFLNVLTQKVNTRGNILLLSIINLLATPQAYIQTLFVTYLIILIALMMGMFLKNLNWAILKRAFKIFIIIFTVNLFWILPQIYFLKTSSHIVLESKANVLSTNDLSYINKDKGDLLSFIRLEGFYYELSDPNRTLFDSWKKHFGIFPMMMLPYLLFGIGFIGFFFVPKFKLAFSFAWMVIALALLATTPPFSLLHEILKQNSFISQVFRSPFTKFIIPNVFFLSFFFSIGVYRIVGLFSNARFRLGFSLGILAVILLIYFPAFKGSLFSPVTKVVIPKEYFALFDFFAAQDKNKRISLLPDITFWGWFLHDWGYNGSGFLWYGIEQPIVSRNFDVWSDKSEGYHWEIKTAVEAEDGEALKKIFDKYAVDFLIYDKSLLPIASNIKAIQYDRLDRILAQTAGVSLIKKWNNLAVYKVDHPYQAKNFILGATNLPNIGPRVKLTNSDDAFSNYGVYKTDGSQAWDAFFPFLDLFTQTAKLPHEWALSETNSHWQLDRALPASLVGVEELSGTESIHAVTYKDNSYLEFSFPLSTNIKNGQIIVRFPKLLVADYDLTNVQVANCGPEAGDISQEEEEGGITLVAKGSAVACLSLKDNDLKQQDGYLLKIENKNHYGQRLLFYVLDSTKYQSYLEERLTEDSHYFILPPKYQYGLGYEFNFHNNSYKKIPAKNTLKDLSVFLIPYEKIKQIVYTNQQPPQAKFTSDFTAKKHTFFLYEASVAAPDTYLILNQAFHPGWKAFGGEEHILINNWANGWKISQAGEKITIFFWPQLLQFVGFGIFGGTILYLLKMR